MVTTVIYVHGLWMTGFEGAVLRRRLAKALDANAPLFAYPSVSASIGSNARRLAARLEKIRTDTLHLVGHSLGGLVILKMFDELKRTLPPGRVVLLGSPVGGSRVANRLAGWKIGALVIGRSAREELVASQGRRWTEGRDLGVIAGSLAVGLGRVVYKHAAPSDGTVFVDETCLPGMKEHLLMRVSHTGMPFSPAVAAQTAAFLREGRFAARDADA
jgi:pimeloyl-ACP methyl ester carboxylesterase